MHAIANRILSLRRRKFLHSKPLFEQFRPISAIDIDQIERQVGATIPQDLAAWLLAVGYGDLDESLSFRFEWFKWFKWVEHSELEDLVIFAQDELGNFYAFVPERGTIVFLSRSAPTYTVLASSFVSFMSELERRDFKLIEWAESLPALPYARDA